MFKTETGKRKQETGKKNNFFVLKIILFLLLFLIFTQILFAQNEALQKIYADLAGNYKASSCGLLTFFSLRLPIPMQTEL